MEHGSTDIKAMTAVAEKLAARLMPTDGGATVVTLSGDLGAGKTTFTRALARAFGTEEDVTSPTYVIEKIYLLAKGPFSKLIHIDAYRLNGHHDLELLGWKELLQASGNLIVVEWPEKVDGIIPHDAINIKLKVMDDDTRTITHDFI
ncbi:MAG: tRNA (adenosine(37)-N6)-threonylcarbamoyltransferase complex ATPase subunit type 1 TsaE [bacterium]|nr:tRNA (adenosine(37)-N6)-threonylcarbamoyltransferase complex ATPase subunit type 1 TsaE [bacterium]